MASIKSGTSRSRSSSLSDQLNAGSQDEPAISAYNIGEYFSTWSEQTGSLLAQDPIVYDGGILASSPLSFSNTEAQSDGGVVALASITYYWVDDSAAFLVNNLITADEQYAPAIAALTGGNYFTAWDRSTLDSVEGRVIDGSGTPVADEFRVNSTVVNDQYDPSIAGLNNGNVVVAFTDLSVDPEGDIRLRLFQPDGTAVALDLPVTTSVTDEYSADVAALADGGFVVSYTRYFGGSDNDIEAQIYNANGTVRSGLISVDSAISLNTYAPSVAGLANGNFVVAWTQLPTAGGYTEVWFERFNPSGVSQGGNVLIDTAGTVNHDIQVVGLQDGGFAVAYTDNESGTMDITARIYDADGSPLSDFLTVNTNLGGAQSLPSLTVLDNGYLVVGWTDDAAQALYHQAYKPDGTPVGSNDVAASATIEGEIAGLSGGLVANVRYSSLTDGSGSSIRSHITELIRTTTGNATSETLTGDALRDVMYGNDGNDSLYGAAGNDSLNDANGNDYLNGGTGSDYMGGGTGNDTFVVDNAGDTVGEDPGEGTDRVNAYVNETLSADVENLYLYGAATTGVGSGLANVVYGNANANSLSGLDGNDSLYGSSGNDSLNGGTGSDYMAGGTGNDTCVVDNAGDIVAEAAAAGTDRINAYVNETLSANVENLYLYGAATTGVGNVLANVIYGNAYANSLSGLDGNDSLYGSSGNDSLNGGAGTDRLLGGTGRDIMTGGNGGDVFDFNAVIETGATASTRDRITDFSHLIDDIDLSTIDANGGAAGNTVFSFRATEGAAFTGVRGQLRWFQQDLAGTASDRTIIAGDINGDASADFQIELIGLKTLTATDFFL